MFHKFCCLFEIQQEKEKFPMKPMMSYSLKSSALNNDQRRSDEHLRNRGLKMNDYVKIQLGGERPSYITISIPFQVIYLLF
jgi:hypothetical protein